MQHMHSLMHIAMQPKPLTVSYYRPYYSIIIGNCTQKCHCVISIINHTLPSTIRAVIGTLACTSMASNSTSNSECYLAARIQVRVLLLPNCLKCVIN